MIRPGLKRSGLLLTIVALQPAIGAELLQNINDDSVNVSIQTDAAEPADRRFSYRVICSPEDEALPDCLPAPAKADNADDKPTMVLPVPDFPADAADTGDDELETPAPVATERAKPHKPAAKKQPKKTVRNSGKKAAKTDKKPAKTTANKSAKKPVKK